MPSGNAISHVLTSAEISKIKLLGTPQSYEKGSLIFSDGDNADHIYFIQTGSVSIFVEKFTSQEEISSLGPGDYFGEMAFFSGDKRSASASALIDTELLSVDKAAFLNLFESDSDIADKINKVFSKRNQELSFKEHMTGGKKSPGHDSFVLGIKGDPSLRFSALSRERYDSVVDRIMSDLQPHLYDLLINRSAYEIFIHCNSGEIHIRTVFDPFNGGIHPASKLLNIAYIERHFPVIAYDEKLLLIKQMYEFIGKNASFTRLPGQHKGNLQSCFDEWEPVSQRDIATTISKLSQLRKIPDFYLRNITISIVRDAIRMQFNCDGTQIVNSQGLLDFIDQNLDEDEKNAMQADEQRNVQRRAPSEQMTRNQYQYGERRSPPGRRQSDWDAITSEG